MTFHFINYTCLVMIDYKKAFDLIDHTLLLQKLRSVGIDNDYVSLFESYLSDRTQYVNINGCHSTLRDANLGVPQGSILGPVLFLIFINDLPKILEHSAADIYADDTTISANVDYRSAPGALNQVLQADVGKIAQWTIDNKMVLNESKTKTMLVAGKRLHKKMSSTSLTVHVNSVELEQVQSHKLLGVIIDTQLNFNEHIDNLCKKLTQRIAVLKKIRRHLPLDQRILYYNAMIKQTMMYGSSVWVSTSVDNLNKVFRLQKRAARVILNADTRANSVDLFRELNWLPFFHEAKINQCAIVYKRLNGVCPDYMLELLKRNIDIRSTERQTRYGSLNLICPKYKRESEGARTFQVSATRFWNSLPNEIKCSSSFEILKKSLFKYFLESYKDVYHFTIA